MKKKILSLAMAGALVLSAGSVVSAADTTINAPTDGTYSSSVEATGEMKTPTINITLSDTTGKKVGLNPYGLEYILGSDRLKDAIANKAETITNASDVPIAVNATTTATIPSGSEAVMATGALKGTETTKSVFAYLQIALGDSVTSDKYDAKAANQLIFGTKATTKKAMVKLDASTGTNKKATYKIFGDVATKPAKAWVDGDTVDFKIVYQFEPEVITATP